MKTESDPFNQISAALAALPAALERIEMLEDRLSALEGQKNAPQNPRKWFTLEQAADALNVSKKTITRYIQRGFLNRSLASRRVLIPVEDIQKFTVKVTV